MTITRVGPLSVAKVAGVLYVVIGLIAGCLVSLLALAGGGFAAAAGDADGAGFGPLAALFGVGAIIFLPIFYGVLGVIGGLLGGAFYNMVAGMVGGVEIDVQ